MHFIVKILWCIGPCMYVFVCDYLCLVRFWIKMSDWSIFCVLFGRLVCCFDFICKFHLELFAINYCKNVFRSNDFSIFIIKVFHLRHHCCLYHDLRSFDLFTLQSICKLCQIIEFTVCCCQNWINECFYSLLWDPIIIWFVF